MNFIKKERGLVIPLSFFALAFDLHYWQIRHCASLIDEDLASQFQPCSYRFLSAQRASDPLLCVTISEPFQSSPVHRKSALYLSQKILAILYHRLSRHINSFLRNSSALPVPAIPLRGRSELLVSVPSLIFSFIESIDYSAFFLRPRFFGASEFTTSESSVGASPIRCQSSSFSQTNVPKPPFLH